jgi:hypothetical protein
VNAGIAPQPLELFPDIALIEPRACSGDEEAGHARARVNLLALAGVCFERGERGWV